MEEYESLSITDFLGLVRKHLMLIILLAIVGGAALGGYTILREESQYQCTGKLVINKESAKVFYEDNYTQNDILMYEKITNTYVEIAKSNAVLKEVAETMKGYSKSQIADMVKISTIPETLILQLDTTGMKQSDVYTMTNTYLNAIIDQCETVLPVGDLTILDEAEFPSKPLSTHLYRNLLIGVAGGVLLGLAFVLLRLYLDSLKISNSQQIMKYIGLEVQTTLLP